MELAIHRLFTIHLHRKLVESEAMTLTKVTNCSLIEVKTIISKYRNNFSLIALVVWAALSHKT